MIIVRVELHSAITHKATELARMAIVNTGARGASALGDYDVATYKGRGKDALDLAMQSRNVNRTAHVLKHPRLKQHVWNLVAKALTAMEYGK